MKIRDYAGLGTKTLAGLFSAYVTLHGIYSALRVDLRANPLLTILYCVFPGLSFFVFLFVRPPRPEAVMQTLLAVGYLITASMLDWRTCAELGYCGTVSSTVLETLRTKPVLAAFAVAILSVAALLLDQSGRKSGTSTPGKEHVLE